MMRRLPLAVLLALAPMGAMAGTMPQMDFHNPLTGSQVIWWCSTSRWTAGACRR
jgi:hypothetical protein